MHEHDLDRQKSLQGREKHVIWCLKWTIPEGFLFFISMYA